MSLFLEEGHLAGHVGHLHFTGGPQGENRLPDVGAHIFRHSLATRMLQRGASLEEISQVLRHRSTTTTQLYARVELEALHGVALPWPGVEVQR